MVVLVAWLWQGMALTLAVAVALRLSRPLAAATRYALWWATLGAVLVLPCAPAMAGLAGSASAPAAVSAVAVSAPLVEPLVPMALPAPADWLIAAAIGVWLGLVLLGLLSLGRAATHLAALRRGAWPMPAGREARLPLWRAVRGSGRAVALALSDEVTAPAALGLGRAMVVLPRALVERLTDEEIDQIVLHEYGHLRRRDDWARLAQGIVQSLVWFHPAVWWIDRQIEIEREAACDDFVVRQTGAARRYAACLARAAELSGSRAHAGTLAPGMAASRQVLLARVGRLLDGRVRRHGLGLAAASLAAGVAALAAGVGTLAQSRPLVAVAAQVAIVPPFVSGPVVGLGFAPAPIAPLGVPVLPAPARPIARAAGADGATPPAVMPALAALGLHRAGDLADSRFDVPGVPVPPLAWAAPASPTLEAAPLVAAMQPVAAPRSRPAAGGPMAAGPSGDSGPWGTVADAGTSVGSGLKKAGVATAGFFTRFGRSVASSF